MGYVSWPIIRWAEVGLLQNDETLPDIVRCLVFGVRVAFAVGEGLVTLHVSFPRDT